MGTEPVDYCRQIETYLCRKNDGHLIRVVGPSFELVSRWETDGVPLKVAFEGIDRYFERYYRKGPRRRPVRIEFCEADVRDVFEEWRRAIGLARRTEEEPHSPSLPAHLERASIRLTSARASGKVSGAVDDLLDRVSHELDAARSTPHGLRGEARRAIIDRLSSLDGELLQIARASLDPEALRGLEGEANEELSAFRAHMPADVYERARRAAVDRLVRVRLGLPTLTYG